ncbi:MAG: 30S ribosomal protein S6 [Patescibacteria group bacterium]
MVEYELFYLVGETKEAELPRIKEMVQKTITDEGAVLLPLETEEKRKLAYEVKKEIRGIYIARRFTLPDHDEVDQETVEVHPLAKINRALMLSKDILRFLILRADTLPELKAIERVEKPKVEGKSNRYERRGSMRAMPEAPITKEEGNTKVSSEEIDEQLKKKLDI